jgi:hypothetical protein
MKRERSHPSWWQLYLLVFGTIGLLFLGALAPLSEGEHQAAAIGTILLFCGLAEVWLRSNTAALLRAGELIVVPQPDPSDKGQTPDDEGQPAPISPWQPQEADGRWAPEGALALQETDGTTC